MVLLADRKKLLLFPLCDGSVGKREEFVKGEAMIGWSYRNVMGANVNRAGHFS